MKIQIEKLLARIAADFRDWQNCRMGEAGRTDIQNEMYREFVAGLRVEEGRKYIKIVSEGSVWGFINKGNNKFRVGDILKAAGWNTPALNRARGNILDGNYEIRWTGPLYL